MIAVLDLETRSPVDLTATGVWPYAAHPLTEIMCAAVTVDSGAPLIYIPMKFQRMIQPIFHKIQYEVITEYRFKDILSRAEITVAQNSAFEQTIINTNAVPRLGWPPLLLEKLHDTMAQLAYCALPLNLDMAGAALNLSIQKDSVGHSVMQKLCKPRQPRKAEREADPDWESKIYWHEDPEDLVTLFNYCGTDVLTERLIYHTLPKLPPVERKIWEANQRANQRGIPVDVENVKAIVKVVSEREEQQLKRFAQLTDGAVSGPRSYVALKEWVEQQAGINLDSVDKTATAELLTRPDIPERVRQALQIKSELSKSSVAKFRAMLDAVGEDGRIRDLFLYHGAATGRYSSRQVQLHNQPRSSYNPVEWELAAEFFRAGDVEALQLFFDDPYYVASRCVRGSFCAPQGSRFLCSDFSSIEAVGEAYLAGEQFVLDAFSAGKDLYILDAAGIFNCEYGDIDKKDPRRQVGKTSTLALGYGGGIGAYATMAKGYGVDLETLPQFILPTATDEELEGDYGARALAQSYVDMNPGVMSIDAAVACDVIKRRWRATHSKTVQFWRGLGEAAFQAVQNPGQVFSFRAIKYCYHRDFLKCLMPSGRTMHYYKPKINDTMQTWGEVKPTLSYMSLKVIDGKTTRQWGRTATYGPKLAENCVSGEAEVLTPGGWVKLKKWTPIQPVWDGIAFVKGESLINKGVKSTIEYLGVRLTPDHLLWTVKGWKSAYATKIRGFNRPTVFLPYDYGVSSQQWPKKVLDCALRLWKRNRLRRSSFNFENETGFTKILRVYDQRINSPQAAPPRNDQSSGILGLAVNESSVQFANTSSVEELRRPRNKRVQKMVRKFRMFLERYGINIPKRVDVGTQGQQQRVLSRELLLGNSSRTKQQQTIQSGYQYAVGEDDCISSVEKVQNKYYDIIVSVGSRMARIFSFFKARSSEQIKKCTVYDIQNCGPRNRFVIRGTNKIPFIVHNCTQGYCRDLLSWAMLRLEEKGYPIVLHVHDEAAAELPEGRGSLAEFNRIMTEVPHWAAGMPIRAEGWENKRYHK